MNSVKCESVVIDEGTTAGVTIDEVTIDAVTIRIGGKGGAQRSKPSFAPSPSLGDKVAARAAAVLEAQLERGSMPA
jgi:hypothetical protein